MSEETLKPKLLVWGAGGHAQVVADIVRSEGKFHLAGFIDTVNPARAGEPFCGATVLGAGEVLRSEAARDVKWVIIAIGDCEARLHCADKARALGLQLARAIHPSAVVASDVQIGVGTVLAAGAIIGTGTRLGANVIVNTAASVDHGCELQDGVHIAPGARLGGVVRVGRGTWIGIGAVVRDHITIGAQTMIGAGAVVIQDIPERVVAYGVPAREIRALE